MDLLRAAHSCWDFPKSGLRNLVRNIWIYSGINLITYLLFTIFLIQIQGVPNTRFSEIYQPNENLQIRISRGCRFIKSFKPDSARKLIRASLKLGFFSNGNHHILNLHFDYILDSCCHDKIKKMYSLTANVALKIKKLLNGTYLIITWYTLINQPDQT